MGKIFAVKQDTEITLGVVAITARQLAAFRAVAAAHEARFDVVIITGSAGRDFAAYDFEACVCPMSLATIAKAFDFDLGMIALIEEAQFRGRLIKFARNVVDGVLCATVSETPSR